MLEEIIAMSKMMVERRKGRTARENVKPKGRADIQIARQSKEGRGKEGHSPPSSRSKVNVTLFTLLALLLGEMEG